MSIVLGLFFFSTLTVSDFARPIATGPAIYIATQDGPVSVDLGDVYRKGKVKIESYDLKGMPPLPAGYAALNNIGHRITTTALASGPYSIRFKVDSVGDEKTFKNLRIFHAEPDPFDPDAPVWVDCTGDSSNAPAPNFSERMLDSSSEELGVFVIGKLLQESPPVIGTAELVITSSSSLESVTAPNPATFTVKILNRGPHVATDVGMLDQYEPTGQIISATPSQGRCKQARGRVYCKIGNLAVGAAATIVVLVRPDQGTIALSAGPYLLVNDPEVRASEIDNNFENNNSTRANVRVFPNPNRAPTVTIDSPVSSSNLEDAVLVGPADITITATATDTDGSINKVEFFDNGKLIGAGETLDRSHFVITERNAAYGQHFLEAVATDNGGRESATAHTRLLVNGAANLSISSPADGSVIRPGSPLVIIARASHPSGIITGVEFIASSMSLGEGTNSGEDRYTLRLNSHRGIYWVVAIATDGAGIKTKSTPVTIRVTERPTITLLSPSAGVHLAAGADLHIAAKATQADGGIERVDFYANDVLIGSDTIILKGESILSWYHVKEGTYSLTAVVTNDVGATSKSAPVRITVGATAPKPIVH